MENIKLQLVKVIVNQYIRRDKERREVSKKFEELMEHLGSSDSFVFLSKVGMLEEDISDYKEILGESLYDDILYYIFEVYSSPTMREGETTDITIETKDGKKTYILEKDNPESFFNFIQSVYF